MANETSTVERRCSQCGSSTHHRTDDPRWLCCAHCGARLLVRDARERVDHDRTTGRPQPRRSAAIAGVLVLAVGAALGWHHLRRHGLPEPFAQSPQPRVEEIRIVPTSYNTSRGNVFGYFVNDTQSTIESPQVDIRLYDDRGNVVLSKEIGGHVVALPPGGGRVPFQARVNPLTEHSRIEVSARGLPHFTQWDGARAVWLEVVSEELRSRENRDWRAVVKVRNDHDETVRYAEVVVALFDDEGALVGVETQSVSAEALAPGAESFASLVVRNAVVGDAAPDDHRVWAVGFVGIARDG